MADSGDLGNYPKWKRLKHTQFATKRCDTNTSIGYNRAGCTTDQQIPRSESGTCGTSFQTFSRKEGKQIKQTAEQIIEVSILYPLESFSSTSCKMRFFHLSTAFAALASAAGVVAQNFHYRACKLDHQPCILHSLMPFRSGRKL